MSFGKVIRVACGFENPASIRLQDHLVHVKTEPLAEVQHLRANDGGDKGSGEFAFNALVAVDVSGMEAQLILQDHELFL